MDIDFDNINIRGIRKTDIPDMLATLEKTYLENPHYLSHSCRQMGIKSGEPLSDVARAHLLNHISKHINARNRTGFLLTSGTNMLGFVLIERHVSRDAEPYGELSDLVVLPLDTKKKKQAFSIGQMLLIRAMGQFRSWNIDQVYLESGLHNDAAHRFFKKQGWSEISKTFVHSLRIDTPTQVTPPSTTPDASNIST
jgi:N-acetylglutamate synthase-like GNAT family acetyltransferase